MKVVVCKTCKGKGEILLKKGQWKGCYIACGKCSGCGAVTFVSKQQFRDIVAGRLNTRDL